MSRIFPYPMLTAALLVMWILMNGLTPAQLVLGSIIAFGASFAMVPLEPSKPKVRNWRKIPVLLWLVVVDIAKSNIIVAKSIIAGTPDNRQSGFAAIPLELRDPTALALLACIVTSSPGTAWLEYDSAGQTMLMHILDMNEEQSAVDMVKKQYEPLLLEIFQ